MLVSQFEHYLPNVLTVSRIVLIPIFVFIYIIVDEMHWLAGLLFAAAAITDWLDGYFARRLSVDTKFGAFLDPVADKLIVVSALVVLIGAHSSLWLTLPGLVIIGRELIISAIREWMAEINRRRVVAVMALTKIKTVAQMVAIYILLSNPPELGRPMVIAGLIVMYIATGMTLWSMFMYLQVTWSSLVEGFHHRRSLRHSSKKATR